VRVEVTRPAMTADNIKQEIVEVPNDEWAKREALRLLIREAGEITNAIVFCNKKRTVDIVAKSLTKHGFNAAPLHGDLDQSVRTKTLDGFRSGEVTILVASDVAARGLDIPACSHIFNFDVPYHPDDYVHRVGRTGRAGRAGEAYMLASGIDARCIEAIEKLTKFVIPRRKLEGLAEQVRERPPRDKSREDRGRSRDRGRRGDHREHPVKPHGQVASMEPTKPSEHAPTIEQSAAPMTAAPKLERRPEPARQTERKPERQRERQSDRNPDYRTNNRTDNRTDNRNDHRPKPETAPKQEPVHYAEVMRQKPSNQQRVEVTPVDASQLPAFLLRPVKLPKVVEKTKPAATPVAAETPKPAEKKPRAPRKKKAPVATPEAE
jgi:superfamily II DNA/RNA helicase